MGNYHSRSIIAYLTDFKGLSCRSRSYLIYGIAGRVAFLLLFASTIFSHAAMLKIQEQEGSDDERCVGIPPSRSRERERAESVGSVSVKSGNVSGVGRSAEVSMLAFLAVSMRLPGRGIAVVNAFWIILSSLWELVGVF
jgi:hypothetical protein